MLLAGYFRLTRFALTEKYYLSIQQKEIAMPQTPKPALKLREQLHAIIRTKHYSLRTEKTYWYGTCQPLLSRFFKN